jgi:hypothetical protein
MLELALQCPPLLKDVRNIFQIVVLFRAQISRESLIWVNNSGYETRNTVVMQLRFNTAVTDGLTLLN